MTLPSWLDNIDNYRSFFDELQEMFRKALMKLRGGIF